VDCNRGQLSRRDLFNRAACGLVGGLAAVHQAGAATAAEAQPSAVPREPVAGPSRVALTHGEDRADNVCKALKLIEPQIRQGLARKKTVVIKPNMVSTEVPLSATNAECLRGILEFLKPLVKDEVIVAESAGTGPSPEGYSNYKYYDLKKDYRVRFVDIDAEPFVIEQVVTERFHTRPVRVSRLLADPDTYVISAAILKTHNAAVTTMGCKNIVFGSILKDKGFRWGKEPDNPGSDKPRAHGGPEAQGIHFNLFTMAKRVHADLSVLDGYQGMERNGPVEGTPVDHKVAVASTDWLAADRVGVELIGLEFRKVGYLTFCAQAGMGQADMRKIEVLGERVADHVKTYRLADNIDQQLKWM
jgi:uncharacterized protein (DUF362 family)